ncbi:hypothetical protein [Pelagibius sp. Alg239-R121]|uniref:hypothetical protein n=1 Tax=Pelagibius sp. Alg239-R121 TaxID=2993448 RepID=UPI0024A7A214|nr:hypothetical protein [Pelagibius sp. Alg239-R121]
MPASSKRPSNAALHLSVTHDPGKSELFGLLICLVICLIFGSFFVYELIQDNYGPYDDPSEDVIPLAGFSLGALFFAGWSLRVFLGRLKKKRIYRLEEDEILCLDGRGLLWREPKENYRQVRWHEETRSYLTKYGRKYYTVQVITLDHVEPSRSFEIFAHQDSPQLQDDCTRWAEALGLPVVRTEAGQSVERAAEELHKPLTALAREGRLPAGFDVTEPPPPGAKWGEASGLLWVKLRPTLVFAVVLAPLFVLVGTSSVIEAGQFVEEGMTSLIFSLSLALFLILVTMGARQTLRITRAEIVIEYRLFGLKFWQQRLPCNAVTRITRSDVPLSDGVLVEADQKRLYVLFLNRKTALWLIIFLQAAIVKTETG